VSLELPNVIARAASDVAVPLSSLVLELTESQLLMDPLLALDILTRLRLKRVGLSIDDFGTGYSSLAQLRDVPFDELKLDRGFVHGAWQNASLRAIFESSVGLATRLGMKTVAEGVEDQADWDFVRRTRCDLAQGNFIGRPMPADLLPGWLREWETRRTELAEA
jgi:EAL domain-containing protein (putative c-di-GMP-specific phosphodiesterase class I)